MADTQVFTKQLLAVLPTIFQKKAYFVSAFGQLQAIDGIRDNAVAFTVKTNDMPVIINPYSKDANVAFGTGTANSSRFGARQEVKYVDTDVPYNSDWAFDEGLDKHTVNADLDAAVASRLVAQAQALLVRWNSLDGAALVAAGTDIGVDSSDPVALFNAAAKAYTQLEIIEKPKAYVTSDLYNALVDSTLTTTGKNSTVNIDQNGLSWFKGFNLVEVPDVYMNGKEAIFAPDGVGKTFVGIATTRTITPEGFDGVALQGAGKDGTYIPEANKKAILFASKA